MIIQCINIYHNIVLYDTPPIPCASQVFNFRRNEVRSFLLGAALFWAERYHVDGFRCDAVSSMIYRDFGKQQGEWLPNENGHVSNLEAVSLLQELNRVMKELLSERETGLKEGWKRRGRVKRARFEAL